SRVRWRPADAARPDDRQLGVALEGGRAELAEHRDLLHRRAVQPSRASIYRDDWRPVLRRNPCADGADLRDLPRVRAVPRAMGSGRAAGARVVRPRRDLEDGSYQRPAGQHDRSRGAGLSRAAGSHLTHTSGPRVARCSQPRDAAVTIDRAAESVLLSARIVPANRTAVPNP